MTEQDWLRCEDPDAMLAFLSLRARVDEGKLRRLACACCRFAANNVTWGWTPEAEQVLATLERIAAGNIGTEHLAEARQTAERLSREAFAHHEMMTRHAADPSDYVHAMDALFHAADADAFTAASRAAASAIASFVGCPMICGFNDNDFARQAQARRSIADLIREHAQPFGLHAPR